MENSSIEDKLVNIGEDAYFRASDEREVVTPENIAGLLEYPAMYEAMKSYRDLRPALGEGQSAGRAFCDFLTMGTAEFSGLYLVANGPENPKTGKPYGTDSKAYQEWAAKQDKKPISPAQFDMFGKMAKAYEGHGFVAGMTQMKRIDNAILKATLSGVDVMAKIDRLYVSDGAVIAVDVKTTDDLCGFSGTASRLRYREQQALISLILSENDISDPQVRIAAVEKGPIPRCGIFAVSGIDSYEEMVCNVLEGYAKSLKSGVFGTGFEAPVLL